MPTQRASGANRSERVIQRSVDQLRAEVERVSARERATAKAIDSAAAQLRKEIAEAAAASSDGDDLVTELTIVFGGGDADG